MAALGGELRRHRRLGRRERVQAVRKRGAARAASRESAARRAGQLVEHLVRGYSEDMGTPPM